MGHGVQCLDLLPISYEEKVLTHPVLRFGYLPMVSSTPGYGSLEPLWTFSQLGLLETGGWGWDRLISTYDSMRYYSFPLPEEVYAPRRAVETTKSRSQSLLEFVYGQFAKELEKRKAFTPDFLADLRKEDHDRLEENLTVWAAFSPSSEIVASWGLYLHSEGSYAGKYEVIRTATDRTGQFTLQNMLPLISEYFRSSLIRTGTVMVRTDRSGMVTFRRFTGATVVGTYDNETKYELEMSVEVFLERFPSPQITHGNQPLQLVRFLDEDFII